MTPNTIAVAITLVTNAITSVVVLAVIVLTLNGYSESDATYGMVTWLILVVICILLTCSAAFAGVQTLIKRKITPLKAVLIAAVCTSVAAILLNIACGIVGVATAEFVRTYF